MLVNPALADALEWFHQQLDQKLSEDVDYGAILSTGLFGECDDGDLYATWSGQYVLPYFDADGRPVFAISRATDPVHSADWKGNKYDKL